MGQITANALAWAGFRSAGGFRRSAYVCIAYAVIVLGLMTMSLVLNPRRGPNDVFSMTPRFLLGAQMAIMGLFVSGSILSTIQRDNTSKMLESHRLMPINPRLAVLGYMAGSAAPVAPLMLFNFIIGGMSAGMAGLPLEWWVAANIVVITFCIFLWSIVAGAGLYHQLFAIVAVVPIGIMVLSGGGAGMGLPSVLMLASPLLGPSVFSATPLVGDELLLWVVAMILQVGVGWVFIEMGARRFRSPELPPITPGWGTLLIALLAAGATVAVNHGALAINLRRPEPQFMAMGTCILLLIVAAIVISSVAACDRLEYPHRATRIVDAPGILLIAVIVLIATGFAASLPNMPLLSERVLWTAGAFVVGAALAQFWAKILFKTGIGVGGLFLVALLVCFVPLLASIAFVDRLAEELTPAGRVISQISPLSLIVAIWSNKRAVDAQLPSLLIQALIATVPAYLLWRRRGGIMAPMLKPLSD